MSMKKTIVIGLTGQTGAGKSTVCGFAGKMGIPVINADSIAREIMSAGSECLTRLAEAFGEDILFPDGSLNRKLLAKRAFSSKEKTALLNSVTHPYIIGKTKQRIAELSESGADTVIFDAPQLFESGGNKLCDIIAAVTAPEEVRLRRIMERDGITREEALLRMKAQHSEEFFKENCRYIIDGSLSLEEVEKAARGIFFTA